MEGNFGLRSGSMAAKKEQDLTPSSGPKKLNSVEPAKYY
jgi:hypothetical protein